MWEDESFKKLLTKLGQRSWSTTSSGCLGQNRYLKSPGNPGGIFGMMSSRCLKLSLGGGVRQSEKIFHTNIVGSFAGVLPHLKKLATQFSIVGY